eukprot:6369526-Prymnesium_polylepis.2
MAIEATTMSSETGWATDESKMTHVLTAVAIRMETRPRPKARRAVRNSTPYCVARRPSAESRGSRSPSVLKETLPYEPSPSR